MDRQFIRSLAARAPDFIRTDFPRKMIALFFAILVWFSVVSKLGKEAKISRIPVTMVLPKGLVALDDVRPQVTLRIKASEKRLDELYPSDFAIDALVNENEYVPNERYELNLEPKNVKAPTGVVVLEVEPNTIFVNLDKTMTRSVVVKPKLSGSPPSGYAVGRVSVIPPKVSVSGPASLVVGVKAIQTDPIPLDKTTIESFDYPITVQNRLENVTVSPSRVMVQVEIHKALQTRIFRSIPIKALEPTGKPRLTVVPLSTPHVDLEVYGPKDVIETLKADEIKAFVDLSAFEEAGIYKAPVRCWFTRPNISVRKIEPAEVEVSITEKER